MPVLSVHAPCLLISQRVWGANPIPKLERSVRAAEQLGAQTVVVHPPFRWQRRYAEGFSDQVAELEAGSDVMVAVENMFPFRADRFFGVGQTSIERMRKRGGRPGPGISAFAPSYDPLDGGHAHYTLDLSHTATAGTDAVDMARRMGDGLVHLHLCDGSGASDRRAPGAGPRHPADGGGLRNACGQRILRPRDPRGHHLGREDGRRARGPAQRIAPVRPQAPAALTEKDTRVWIHPVHRRDGAHARGRRPLRR